MHPLEVSTTAVVLAGLTLHSYLDNFYDRGEIPYPRSFSLFVNLFALAYCFNFIWIFGAIAGLVITVLCYLQIVHSAVLWIIWLPYLARVKHAPEKDKLNRFLYWCHSKIAFLTGALAVANCVVIPFGHGGRLLEGHYAITIVVSLVVLAVGNMVRMATFKHLIEA
jgi:hypothetical protein